MCTGLTKYFSCIQAAKEREERDERDRCPAQKDCSLNRHHRHQLTALSQLSATESMAPRRRTPWPVQRPTQLPAATAASLNSRRQRELQRERCNSYTAMERHDQILEEIAEQL
ncbi:hypothetical protein AWZ03_014816 [Drosophila navojoa]|uniref:Uncharacterized protein n=1 Tax=Drosophila navojoa TaxID=7232 RepID=A0A484APZ0_DRONA|nr:hypothetical protein AWZ03_014816 [Drosophila navojoa]